MENRKWTPRILAFLCHWCGYSCADLAGTSRTSYPPSIRTIEVMCSCMVHPDWIIKALMSGLDGVMIFGCHPGECHYGTGNELAAQRQDIVSETLEEMGMEPERFSLHWVSAAEARRFAGIVSSVTEKIRRIGPNPLSGDAFSVPNLMEKPGVSGIPFIHIMDRTSYYWDGNIYNDEHTAHKALTRYFDMELEAKLVPAKQGLLIYTRRSPSAEKS